VDPAEAQAQIETLTSRGLDQNASAIWDLSGNVSPEDRTRLYTKLKKDALTVCILNSISPVGPWASAFQGDWMGFLCTGGLQAAGLATVVGALVWMNKSNAGGSNGSGFAVLVGAALYMSGRVAAGPVPFLYAADYNRRLEEALRLEGRK